MLTLFFSQMQMTNFFAKIALQIVEVKEAQLWWQHVIFKFLFCIFDTKDSEID